jgi:CHAT domain-containing protein
MSRLHPRLHHSCGRWLRWLSLALLTAFSLILWGGWHGSFSGLRSEAAGLKAEVLSHPNREQILSEPHPIIAAADLPLDRQAQALFAAGNFREAAQAFQRAAAAHQAGGDRLRQALSLSNAGLAYQQVADWAAANQAITASLGLLQEHSPSPERSSALAQTLTIQGALKWAQGQAEPALTAWTRATQLYEQMGDLERATETRVNQARVFQALGLHRRAIALLSQTLKLEVTQLDTAAALQSPLATLPPTASTLAALHSLSESLRLSGNLDPAQAVVQRAQAIAEQLQQPGAITMTQFKQASLTRAQAGALLTSQHLPLARAVELLHLVKAGRRFPETELALAFQQQMETALAQYQQAANQTPDPSQRLQVQLSQLSLLAELQRWSAAQSLLPSLRQSLEHLPATRSRVDAQINLAQTLLQFPAVAPEPHLTSSGPASLPLAVQLLVTAAQQAQSLGDPRGESYALGLLGQRYEQAGQRQEAISVTQRALQLAQSLQAQDIAYRWQWQLGRLQAAAGNRAGAIAAYRGAVASLESVRRELVATALESQFSFRDAVEPIHRELVELLLQESTAANRAETLGVAREVIESLQLTELVNFFREDCLIAKPNQVDQVDAQSAVLYPMILSQRLAVIARLPGQPLSYYATPLAAGVTPARVEQTVSQLQAALQQGNLPEETWLPLAEQLYDWLIRPIQAQLAASQIKTLVFIPDGVLRNIPLGVLRDRATQQYLIEQYSVALTPGLQLLASKPLTQDRLRALGGGLTAARGGFAALPNVETELQQLSTRLPESRILLDQGFTQQVLKTHIRSAPATIVHLATHGQFSSQLDQTFLLTWDGRLTVNQLREALQTRELNPNETLELLILSACETATGDRRAALGLAGIAVRAGARSTIGTLWQVNDASSSLLMQQFYQEITQTGVSKAEALRRAQLSLLKTDSTRKYHRPYYWAPYVLVGNWQ